MPAALYVVEGDVATPDPLTAGPWSPDAQHGGPVAGLLARAVENVGGPEDLQVVRITVELQRPVPLRPLTTTASISRPGRRIDVVEAELRDGATVLARARALRIRVGDVPLPAGVDEPWPATPSDPSAATPAEAVNTPWPMFHLAAMEMRYVEGSWRAEGPAMVWERLRLPLVEGETPTPLQRVVTASDSGNGISHVVPFGDYSFINPDLTVALSRTPVGEWIGADARTRLNPQGWGQAESMLFDTAGVCGRAVQSLIVEKL